MAASRAQVASAVAASRERRDGARRGSGDQQADCQAPRRAGWWRPAARGRRRSACRGEPAAGWSSAGPLPGGTAEATGTIRRHFHDQRKIVLHFARRSFVIMLFGVVKVRTGGAGSDGHQWRSRGQGHLPVEALSQTDGSDSTLTYARRSRVQQGGGDCRCRTGSRQHEPVPAAAQGQSGRLVGVGRRGLRRGAAPRRPGPAQRRLRRLPLVPRDGARVLRGRRDRRPT